MGNLRGTISFSRRTLFKATSHSNDPASNLEYAMLTDWWRVNYKLKETWKEAVVLPCHVPYVIEENQGKLSE
jgi:hypothetical protein